MIKTSNAIILLSGGIDSTTSLVWSINKQYECYALSFDYGQNHLIELEYAKHIAKKYNCKDHFIIKLDFNLTSQSALTGSGNIPIYKSVNDIPNSVTNTYVQARNLIFLSYATGLAERLNINKIIFGINKEDVLNFPDCSKEFIDLFEKAANEKFYESKKVKDEAFRKEFLKRKKFYNKHCIVRGK